MPCCNATQQQLVPGSIGGIQEAGEENTCIVSFSLCDPAYYYCYYLSKSRSLCAGLPYESDHYHFLVEIFPTGEIKYISSLQNLQKLWAGLDYSLIHCLVVWLMGFSKT